MIMINNFYEYFLLVVINILDIGMLYYLTRNITTPRNKWLNIKEPTKMPKLSFQIIVLGILYGIIIGYFGYLFRGEILLRLIGIVVIWIIIMYIAKEKLKNAIIIYALLLATIGVVQSIVIIPMNWINIPSNYAAIIAQSFGFTMIIALYKKISLHKLFIFVKGRLSGVNFFLLMAFSISMSIAYFISHSYSSGPLIIILIIVLNTISVYRFIVHAQKLNSKFHHTESVYEGLDYLLKTEDDLHKIQRHYTDTLKRIEFEIPESNFQTGKHRENIIEFIESKKASRKAKMDIVKEVKFYFENRIVSLSMMIYMLGTLLNNAFDTKTKKPLFVDVKIAAHSLEITVSNASDNKSYIEIAQMFEDGSSSKKGNRGYGLPNLSRVVKSYGGDIAVSCDYKEEYKSYYLTMMIRIKQFN